MKCKSIAPLFFFQGFNGDSRRSASATDDELLFVTAGFFCTGSLITTGAGPAMVGEATWAATVAGGVAAIRGFC